MIHTINNEHLCLSKVEEIISTKKQLELSNASIKNIQKCRDYLDNNINNNEAIYGINTGFGALCNCKISDNELEQLQHNLVMSHACGTGNEVPKEIVKLMLLLKIQSLSYGHSGVQVETVKRLIYFYNNDILPVVYEQGSLGASGDLAPLAHLSLPLIGLGEVNYMNNRIPTSKLLEKLKIDALNLKSKEGLALLNGTQFMSAYATFLLIKSKRLLKLADIIATLSLDAYDGRIEPFNMLIHKVRPHQGQKETAECFLKLLANSEIIVRHKTHVQDPYSFRCIPQVHGATKDTVNFIEKTIETEINSVTDNPTVFPDDKLIISAGNFHGQPLALGLDFLAIAMAEIGNISERRTYQLISGKRGLPSFLVAKPGLNSGFMIPQYTAASIVSQNKQYCTPASVDSIESSQGQEDHVSMGANAAVKAYKVVENIEKILAIELLNAAQAIEFRRPLKTSAILEQFVSEYRKHVKFVENDRVLFYDIQNSITFIQNTNVDIITA